MDFLKSKIANRESFRNSYVDVVIEFNQSVKDWLNFEFKKVVYRYKAKFNAVVTNIDEDDVQFGYIEYKTVVIPFIAQYINSNNNRGHVFRLYFFIYTISVASNPV